MFRKIPPSRVLREVMGERSKGSVSRQAEKELKLQSQSRMAARDAYCLKRKGGAAYLEQESIIILCSVTCNDSQSEWPCKDHSLTLGNLDAYTALSQREEHMDDRCRVK